MKQLQPVIWSKGTFLTPQHMQLQDRFLEDSLRFHLHAVNFRDWGFTELAVDQEQIADGVFGLSRAAGILPDGVPFEMPDSDPPPKSRPLSEHFEAGQTTLDVYLALPDYRPHGVNVSLAPDKSGTRFLARLEMLRDENTGVGEKPVHLARKNFRLLFEGESREGATTIRAARIEQTGPGVFRLAEKFIPPLLQISASEYLMGLLRSTVELLSGKSSLLSGSRRQKNQGLAEFSASDIANFWLLYTVNSNFPAFHHLLRSRRGHPEQFFSALTELAGTLTTFSKQLRPADLPIYDHDELGTCFTGLFEKTVNLLETVVPSNFVSLPLKLVKPSIYAAAIDNDKYLADTKLFLAITADTDEAELIRKVPQLVKMCSATHIEHLIQHALPGIQMTHVPNPPTAIPVKLKYQYFSLSRSGAVWEAVQRARNIAAYVSRDFPDPQMELIILLPEAG